MGVILTSTQANSTKNESTSIEEDYSYLEDVSDYVDEYIDSITSEEIDDSEETVKIYGKDGELILEEVLGDDISEETLKLIRQADFLTEYDNTTYYRLNI